FSGILSKSGAEPVSFPTIKITAPPSYKDLDRAIARLATYDWLILTSVNGVSHFFARLKKLGKDVRELKGVKICAIGPMTKKAIEAENITVDIMPTEYRAEAVLKALGKRRIKGKKFLLPRAMKAREILPTEIKKLGGRIDVAVSYKTIAPKKDSQVVSRMLKRGEIDVVTFTSSSTVTNFAKIFGKKNLPKLLKSSRVACIGPITAIAASELGITVDIMPADYTVAALTREMESYFSST
ncbi:MAG: uroporphyrinogen-III synthase, partial [Thermodesulfobacteriota bacterium]